MFFLSILRGWAVASQQTACRNAMVAGTAIAARRAESSEVAVFVADALAARAAARAG